MTDSECGACGRIRANGARRHAGELVAPGARSVGSDGGVPGPESMAGVDALAAGP